MIPTETTWSLKVVVRSASVYFNVDKHANGSPREYSHRPSRADALNKVYLLHACLPGLVFVIRGVAEVTSPV